MSLTVFGASKAKPNDKLSPGLARLWEQYQADRDAELPIIVQVDPDSFHPHGAPPGLVKTKVLGLVNGFAGQMSVKGIQGLVHSPWIDSVTIDAAIRPPADQILTSTVGVDQLQPPLVVGANTGPSSNGSGVVMAVLWQGTATRHRCKWPARFFGTLRHELLNHVLVLAQGKAPEPFTPGVPGTVRSYRSQLNSFPGPSAGE